MTLRKFFLFLLSFCLSFLASPLFSYAGEHKGKMQKKTTQKPEVKPGLELQFGIEYIRGKTTDGKEKLIRLSYPQPPHPLNARTKRIEKALSVTTLLGASPVKIGHTPALLERFNNLRSEITVNDGNLLAVVFFLKEQGKLEETRKDILLNPRNGRKVAIKSLFLPGSLSALQKKIDAKMQKDIKHAIRVAETLGDDVADYIKGQHFQAENIETGSITKKGVCFYFPFGFPLYLHQFRPKGEYCFSFKELSVYIPERGLLARYR